VSVTLGKEFLPTHPTNEQPQSLKGLVGIYIEKKGTFKTCMGIYEKLKRKSLVCMLSFHPAAGKISFLYTGRQPSGANTSHIGCEDKTPLIQSEEMYISSELFFVPLNLLKKYFFAKCICISLSSNVFQLIFLNLQTYDIEYQIQTCIKK